MTATPAETEPAVSATSGGDLNHVYCCDPDTAWCGTDVSDAAEVGPDTDIDCVVCAELEDLPCPVCGA